MSVLSCEMFNIEFVYLFYLRLSNKKNSKHIKYIYALSTDKCIMSLLFKDVESDTGIVEFT